MVACGCVFRAFDTDTEVFLYSFPESLWKSSAECHDRSVRRVKRNLHLATFSAPSSRIPHTDHIVITGELVDKVPPTPAIMHLHFSIRTAVRMPPLPATFSHVSCPPDAAGELFAAGNTPTLASPDPATPAVSKPTGRTHIGEIMDIECS